MTPRSAFNRGIVNHSRAPISSRSSVYYPRSDRPLVRKVYISCRRMRCLSWTRTIFSCAKLNSMALVGDDRYPHIPSACAYTLAQGKHLVNINNNNSCMVLSFIRKQHIHTYIHLGGGWTYSTTRLNKTGPQYLQAVELGSKLDCVALFQVLLLYVLYDVSVALVCDSIGTCTPINTRTSSRDKHPTKY